MRPGALLVNVARGTIVDEGALVEALRAGVIAGAALDVFDREPIAPDSPLWDLPNVVITPHTSGLRPDYFTCATDLFIENLHRYRAGQSLRNVVDKEAGY
jgi:phosphoglycerate dehydrogenase-like enzyme